VDNTDSVTGKTVTVGTNEQLNQVSNGVVDFRAKKKQLKDVARLIGEYDGEWFISFDQGLSPKFNVVQQRGGGTPVKTFATEEGATKSGVEVDNNADFVEVETDDVRGSFKQVVVKGYGDGEDQIEKVADDQGNIISSPVKGKRTLVFTDKTIISERQAERKAKSLAETHSATYKTINVEASDPNQVFQVGDVIKVEDKDTGVFDTTGDINGGFRVVRRHYKITFDRDSKLELELDNKPKTFLSQFKQQENVTKSQTDHMQGARNIYGDKESGNASPSKPLTVDFEVPKDVKDISGKNRVERIEFNYAAEELRQGGDPVPVTAENFDPGTKVVSTDVKPGGTEIERSEIARHGHPTGSSTSNAATGRRFTGAGFRFENTSVPASGWTLVGDTLNAINPEEDIAHRIDFEITNMNGTVNDLHIAVLSSNAIANFRFSPDPPVVQEEVFFENTSSSIDFNEEVDKYEWQFGDGTTEVLSNAGFNAGDNTHTYTSSGSFTVTLALLRSDDTVIDSVQKVVEVQSASDLDVSEIEKSKENLSSTEEKALEMASSDDVVAQDDVTRIFRGDPDEGDIYYIGDGGFGGIFISYNGTIETNDGGVLDVNIAKTDEDETLSFGDPEGTDGDSTSVVGDDGAFQSYDLEIFQRDNSELFEGVGEFGYIMTFNANDGSFLFDARDDIFTVYDVDANIISPSDNSTVESSDVTFEVEGTAGEGNNDGELFVDGNSEKLFDTEGFTQDIYEGNSRTVSIGATDVTLKVDNVNSDNEADVTVDGTSHNNVSEGDVLSSGAANTDIVISKITDSDNDGDLLANYTSVVFEGFFSASHTVNNVPNGDRTAKFEMQADQSNRSDAIESDSIDFTVNLNNPPTAAFTFSPSSPSANENIQFTDNSTDDKGIVKWEWDFGDGTSQVINADPDNDGTNENTNGDIIKSYTESGSFTVSLTVTDTNGVTATATNTVNVSQGDALVKTQAYTGVKQVGASSSNVSTQVVQDATTAAFTGVAQVGTQKTPAKDVFLRENFYIPYRDISDKYEVYVATQQGGSPTITGNVELNQLNHVHEIPRQSNFPGVATEIGGGAQNRSIEYKREGDRGSLLLDFSKRDEAVTLDTTPNSNDVTVTVANEEDVTASILSVNKNPGSEENPDEFVVSGDVTDAFSDTSTFEVEGSSTNVNTGEYVAGGNITTNASGDTVIPVARTIQDETAGGNIRVSGVLKREETIGANNGVVSTGNFYQDDELFVRIEAANNTDPFILRNGTGDTEFTLSATSGDRFRAAKTSQATDGVSSDDGTSQDLVEGVDPGLIGSSVADNVQVFIDPEPDTAADTEKEITGELYSGSSNSGKSRDKRKDLLAAASNVGVNITEPGFYQLKLKPNEPTFLKSRVFLDHHKDTTNEN